MNANSTRRRFFAGCQCCAPSNLPRVLGYTTATAIVVGTVIGSGVFKKASVVSANVPESGLALLAWVLVGVLTLLGALTLGKCP